MNKNVLRVCAMAAVMAPAVARAQTATVGTDTAFDVQTFWPTGGPTEHLALRSSSVSPSGAVGFGLLGGFMLRPLTLLPRGATQASAAVDYAITADFLWNVGIARRFQLSAAIPVVVAQDGDGTVPILGTRGARLPDTALRDLRLEASWAIVQRQRVPNATGVGLRLDLGATIPFGDTRGFNSTDGFSFAPMLAADWRLQALTFTVNAGARLREARRFADIVVGHTLVVGAGVALHPGTSSRFGASLDYFGTIGVASTGEGGRNINTHELFVGLRYATDAAHDVEIVAGGAIGLGRDPLTPASRVFLGLSYAPRGNDTDSDGVLDTDDRCITEREDRDDFDDEDGCPDLDNDGDQVPDAQDRCPNEPEDADNHEDTDGCPDDDNDGDGVNDSDDQCADTPAGEHPDGERAGCPVPDTDSDGVLDPDDQCVDVAAGARPDPTRAGCPLPDDDGDGIVNRDDACPNQPAGARADRWRSGCPDNDPDHDGVLGESDRCPEQPETINSVTDNDGCPDQGASLVTWAESGESLRFARPFVMAPRVQSLSPWQLPLATQAALRVRARGGEVSRVVIEVMPGVGAPAAAEAARLAGIVRDIFIAQRIGARMVVAQAAQRPAAVRPGVRVLPPAVGSVFIRIERRPEPSTSSAPTAN